MWYVTVLKGLCNLLISSLHQNILFLFSELFINVDAIIYMELCNKNNVTQGCKTQVNTQLLISQEMADALKNFFYCRGLGLI